MKRLISVLLIMVMFASAFTLPVFAADAVIAFRISSQVFVNGVEKSFDAYNIGGNNYFKLRDIAFVLSGTAKQFDVEWDADKNAVNIVSGNKYKTVGGEMMTSANGLSRNAVLSDSSIYLDGKIIKLTAYNIGGNNYFKLRDLGEVLDFTVEWNEAANAVIIDSAAEEKTEPPNEDEVYAKMTALMEKYPNGMKWTNDNYFGWNGGIYNGGYGCAAFAFMLSDAAFGDLPARQHKDFSKIRIGDIVRINNDTHSVIIIGIDDTNVTIAEGNFNSSVNWGRKITIENISKGDYIMTRYPE